MRRRGRAAARHARVVTRPAYDAAAGEAAVAPVVAVGYTRIDPGRAGMPIAQDDANAAVAQAIGGTLLLAAVFAVALIAACVAARLGSAHPWLGRELDPGCLRMVLDLAEVDHTSDSPWSAQAVGWMLRNATAGRCTE